jgi:hypothetical protein
MDEETVHQLASAADLRLADVRLALIAPQLEEWLTAANELSRALAAEEHRELTPITAFHHPTTEPRAE